MSSKLLTVILIATFVLRAAAIVGIGHREPGPDALDDYLPMAANLRAGNGIRERGGRG